MKPIRMTAKTLYLLTEHFFGSPAAKFTPQGGIMFRAKKRKPVALNRYGIIRCIEDGTFYRYNVVWKPPKGHEWFMDDVPAFMSHVKFYYSTMDKMTQALKDMYLPAMKKRLNEPSPFREIMEKDSLFGPSPLIEIMKKVDVMTGVDMRVGKPLTISLLRGSDREQTKP